MPSVRPRWSEQRIWWTATAILVAWWAVALGLAAAIMFWLGWIGTWMEFAGIVVGGGVIAYLADRLAAALQRRLERRKNKPPSADRTGG